MPSLSALKAEVRDSRPPGDPLRETILAERDQVSAEEYAAKVPIWLTLLRLRRVERGAGTARETIRAERSVS